MNPGRRLAWLRIARGESLREAALRTGVSHSTIARLEKGEVTSSYHETLRKIAEGYGVTLEYLVSGQAPQKQGGHGLRPLTPEERSLLLFAPGRERVRRAVELVTGQREGGTTREQLAAALGLDEESLQRVIDGQEPIPAELAERLQEYLGVLTGLSPLWFRWSMSEEAPAGGERPQAWGSYLRLVEKTCRADLHPNVLAMAIDLLRLNDGRPDSVSSA